MYRRRGYSPRLLRDPGWVVELVVVEDVGQWGRQQKQYWEKTKNGMLRLFMPFLVLLGCVLGSAVGARSTADANVF